MSYTDPDVSSSPSSSPKKATLHFKPIVPSPAPIRPASLLSHSARPLTPDPSPTMNPEDPKIHHPYRDAGSATHASPHDPLAPSKARRLSKSTPAGQQQLPTFSDLNKTASTPYSSMSSPTSGASSSSRALHTLYPNGTPPMSPGHALVSPISRPHYGITDPSQYSSSSSSGFYQLPPPLQPFIPRQSPHQSPAMQPQSSHSHVYSSSLPPLPSSGHPNSGYSPRSTPHMSPLPSHHYSASSPAVSPLSPYPTPHHHPRHYSSPHHEPLVPKQSIPTMILPASALSSGASSQDFSSRSSFSAILSPTASDVEMSSLTTGPIRSEPSSPRRRTMPPPHSTPVSTSTASLRSSRLQARKGSSSTSAVQSSSSDNITSGTGESSSKTAGSRRRASSNSKQVDQQTRDLMRKVSHSAIERRRRERINDKILQLKHLVPACVDEDHLHKLSILQSTIEYIQHLKAIVPATVANAKIGKATNNNPNNKTTDMLEAMGGSISAKSPLTPLMTTGLSHIYAKGIKVEKRDIRELLEDHSQSLSLSVSSSSSSSSSPSDDDAKDGLLLLATQSSAISPSSQAKRFQEGMRRNSREREDEDSEGDDC